MEHRHPGPQGQGFFPPHSATSQKAIARGAPLQVVGPLRAQTNNLLRKNQQQGGKHVIEPWAPKREELWVTAQPHPQVPTQPGGTLITQKSGSLHGVLTTLFRQDPSPCKRANKPAPCPDFQIDNPPSSPCTPTSSRQSYGIIKNHWIWG